MAVEKMHFISIIGLIEQLDDFVISNIVPFDIQLVDAYETLDSMKGIQKFSEENKYEKMIARVKELAKASGKNFVYDAARIIKPISFENMTRKIEEVEEKVKEFTQSGQKLRDERNYKQELFAQIKPLDNLPVEVEKLFFFKYIKFRYGKMPTASYKKLREYSDNLDVIVYRVSQDEEFSYVMYFTPVSQELNMDSLFASLFFERIRISNDVAGKPHEVMESLSQQLEKLNQEIEALEKKSLETMAQYLPELEEYYQYLVRLNGVFDVRRFAVHTDKAFYLAGWIPDSQIKRFQGKVSITPELSYVIEDENSVRQKPPTKLSNPKFFQPFETVVRMYGIPSYEEMDPTIFVGITYMFLFGMMFGDVGQGLVIALIGYLLSKWKKIEPAKLLVYFGVMSTIFGLFYGSIFGNEELLRHYLPFIPMINPMEVKMELLAISVAFGIGLLIVAMLINLYNLWKNKEYGKLLFDKNGITGLVFYSAVMYIVLSTVMSGTVPVWLIAVLIVVPLVILFFSEKLVQALNRKMHKHTEHVHNPSVIESFFELVEIILAVFSNTISFVRVGAFALNHVGFFLAFHQLSHMVGGVGSVAVMIFGNILIIVLEGMIVGIQGLRLEYYELFSRFYQGNGKEFKPFRIED
ncbi:MAG: V-type ATPase 116kDa subunit family protein [Eubacteriales bacterium]|nr:V-type ATPase 116kDa subunit family protein [Eubacteriales bacterium]